MRPDFIPCSKDDFKAVKILEDKTLQEIEPYSFELLTWIQDMNWPISKKVLEILYPHVNHFKDDVITILKSNDNVWKYWCISKLMISNPNLVMDRKLLEELKRISVNPTNGEIEEDVKTEADKLLAIFS